MTDANVDQIIANGGHQFACGKCQSINTLDQCLEKAQDES
jgi:hypothetical protein